MRSGREEESAVTMNGWWEIGGGMGKDGGGRNGFKNGLIEKKLVVLDSWLPTRGKR